MEREWMLQVSEQEDSELNYLFLCMHYAELET